MPIFNGTLSFNELCEEACEDNTYSVEEMTGCVSKFMKVVQREAARGFRCKLGTDFLTVYPNIQCSVKDELNPDKTVKKAAESKDVKANNAKSRLGCTVSPKYSLLFANSVSWQKVDKNGNVIEEDSVSWQKVDKNGNVIEEEEDDITQGNGNVDPNSGETPTTPEAPENPGTGGGDGDDSGVIS